MNVAKRVTCLKDTVVRFPVGPEEKQMPQRPVTQLSHRTKTNVDNKEKQSEEEEEQEIETSETEEEGLWYLAAAQREDVFQDLDLLTDQFSEDVLYTNLVANTSQNNADSEELDIATHTSEAEEVLMEIRERKQRMCLKTLWWT